MEPIRPGGGRFQRPGTRRGLSVIELALVLPLIMLLVCGLIEYGWVLLMSHHIANASRQGARHAATPDATLSEAEDVIESVMADGGIGVSDYVVVWDPSIGADPGDPFTCTVTVTYADVSLGMPLVPVPTTLESSTTMLKEGP